MTETKDIKTAFAYHRYSTKNQEDGYSLEVQRNTTKEIASKNNCTIIGIYEDEGISGATIDKRPQMLLLLDDLKRLKPDYIICVDQDRIARGNDFWFIKNQMEKSSTVFITDKEGIIDFTKDHSQDFLSDVIAAAAKYSRAMDTVRIKRTVKMRAQKGFYIGNLRGITGYSYKDGNLAVNEEEAKLVKRIFETYSDGGSMHGIAKQLNKEKIRSKRNGLFTTERIKYLLTNKLYIGFIKHGKVHYPGKHDPIISKDLFDKVQAKLGKIKKYTKRRRARYLLTGILRCSGCGSSMGGNFFRRKNGASRILYKCSAYGLGTCDSPVFVMAGKIEGLVINKVKDKLRELKLSIEKREIIIESDDTRISDSLKLIKKLQDRAEKIQEEYFDGYVERDKYRKQIDEINKQLKELSEQEIEAFNPGLKLLKKIDIDTIFDDAEIEDKREIISLVLKKIDVFRMNGSYDITKRIKWYWNKIK